MPLLGPFQPGCVHRCDQVLLRGHLPVRFPTMCRLVRFQHNLSGHFRIFTIRIQLREDEPDGGPKHNQPSLARE